MSKIKDYSNIAIRISDKRRFIEMVAVLITALGKFVFMDFLAWRLPFITIVSVSWIAYIVYRKIEIKGIFKYWGLTLDTFKASALKVIPFGIISVICCFAIGHFQQTINITWHIIPILILYPIWGTIQQLLTIGLIAGNLQDLKYKKLADITIISITALLFAIVHFPYYWLVIGTFLLAAFYSYLYLKIRNLFVLGILHGWLGALFFYTVVGRDPFEEVFGVLFK